MYDIGMNKNADWVDKLKALMQADKKVTPVYIANLMGKTPGNIHHYLNRRRVPPLVELENLATSLGYEPKEFLYGNSPIANRTFIYKWDMILREEGVIDYIDPSILATNHYALKIQDDSMRNFYEHTPTFPIGTVIIIDPKAEIKPGKYVIARESGNPDAVPIFRRYIVSTAGKKLMPLNGALYDKEDADNFDIIGVVVASMNLDL